LELGVERLNAALNQLRPALKNAKKREDEEKHTAFRAE
jgi:hypothetical protein